MIYLTVLFSGLAFSVIGGRSVLLFYFYLTLLWVLASFRYGVGPDYFAYEYSYSIVNTSIIEEFFATSGQEVLFRIFGSIFNALSFSYQQYLAVTALITLFYVAKTCKQYSQYPVISLYLYFCFFYFVWVFSGIRQGLTLAIGTYYLLACLQGRNHLKFFIITTVLSFIHASSWILFLFYGLANLRLKRRTLYVGVLFSFLISLLPSEYFMIFFSNLPFGERIQFYFRPDEGEIIISYFDFKSISRFILLILIGGVFWMDYSKHDNDQNNIMTIYIVSFGVYYGLRFVEILAANASLYGFMLIIIIMPNIYSRIKRLYVSNLFLAFMLTFSIAYFFKNLYSMQDMSKLEHSSLITPYTNIFNKAKYFSSGP